MTERFIFVRGLVRLACLVTGSRAGRRRLLAFALLTCALPANALGSSAQAHKAPAAAHFFWRATAPSSPGTTTIDNKATNNRPGALAFVTANFDAGGGCGCVNDQALVGVYYDGSRWEIANENQAVMLSGQSFNVLVVPRASKYVFGHVAGRSSISGNTTWLNSSLINGKPKVSLQVTQVISRRGGPGVFNDHSAGVLYDRHRKRWGIFNEDGLPMTRGASFNVMVGATATGGTVAAHKVSTASIRLGGYASLVSNALVNGRPKAMIFATPNGSPGGQKVVYDRAPIGMTYISGNLNRWLVYDENYSPMPVNAAFNLLVYSR
jgi:hypothetical protein